jgi:hypothetical protein
MRLRWATGFGALVVTGGRTAAAAVVMFPRMAPMVVCDATELLEYLQTRPFTCATKFARTYVIGGTKEKNAPIHRTHPWQEVKVEGLPGPDRGADESRLSAVERRKHGRMGRECCRRCGGLAPHFERAIYCRALWQHHRSRQTSVAGGIHRIGVDGAGFGSFGHAKQACLEGWVWDVILIIGPSAGRRDEHSPRFHPREEGSCTHSRQVRFSQH